MKTQSRMLISQHVCGVSGNGKGTRAQASQGQASQAEGKRESKYVIKVMRGEQNGRQGSLVFAEPKDHADLPIGQ
jgi:hypothetical protein